MCWNYSDYSDRVNLQKVFVTESFGRNPLGVQSLPDQNACKTPVQALAVVISGQAPYLR